MLFGPELREQLQRNLGRHERLAVPLDERRHAAVAVVVVDSDADAHGDDDLPAEPDELAADPRRRGPRAERQRRRHRGRPGRPADPARRALRAHAGQWALPGGRVDDGERPGRRRPAGAAGGARPRRSTSARCSGALDDYPTRSGYVITPFVLWGGADPELHPHPDEVLSVHRVAFRELCRPDSPRFVSIPESDRPVVQLPIGGDLIHAPTGAVLLQFRRVAIEGTPERVAGYEQPVFAWR